MRLVCGSDTHGNHADLVVPEGDVFIHPGDMTRRGSLEELRDFNDWLHSLPHRYKILVAGNHDFCFEDEKQEAMEIVRQHIYLEDRDVIVQGVKFYGSPWQPEFHDWAFNLERGEELRRMWEMIPDDTDVLVTHGPPAKILDRTMSEYDAGCADLLERVLLVQPKLHVFGHIHEAYGQLEQGGTLFVNASLCNIGMQLQNEPVVVDL